MPEPARPKTRLSDLASLAGVSTATVSRVLNGRPGVAEPKRQAVLTAVESLGYAGPGSALSPRLVAIMVPELSNPSFAFWLEALDNRLLAAGLAHVTCAAGPSGTSEAQHLKQLNGTSLLGVICVSGIPADAHANVEPYRRLMDMGIPAVFINAYSPELCASCFSTSDSAAVDKAVQHLRSLGHERIGLATGQRRYLPARRKEAAFVALGLPASSVQSTTYTVEGGHVAAERLISTGHTAIVCASDPMALGAIRAARLRGLNVPRDISVVGFDDSPMMAFTGPPLTTIRQPIAEMATAAVETLIQSLEGDQLDLGEVVFQPDLIIRSSTSAPASRGRTS